MCNTHTTATKGFYFYLCVSLFLSFLYSGALCQNILTKCETFMQVNKADVVVELYRAILSALSSGTLENI